MEDGERIDPSSNEYKEQHLFLLELFVESVSGSRLAMLNRMFFVPTSVSFQFLDFRKTEGIEVTPVDPIFQPQAGITEDDLVEYFYAGRSVMFALDHHIVTNKIIDFIVTMFVRKKLPREIKPDILVGVGRIDLSKHFAALRKEILHDGLHENILSPKVFEGEVPLMHENKMVGCVNAYVRMSAFGQTVITEFEVPVGDEMPPSYVFKGVKPDCMPPTYKCRIIDSDMPDISAGSKDEFPAKFPCVPCARPSGAVYPNSYANLHDDDIRETQRLDLREAGQQQEVFGKAVVLKVSSVLNSGGSTGAPPSKKPMVTVISESEATRPGDSSFTDPNYDVFILRIGKKGLVGADEKSDIQLEMKTPKGAEKGPPIRLETREMQTEEELKITKKKGKRK